MALTVLQAGLLLENPQLSQQVESYQLALAKKSFPLNFALSPHGSNWQNCYLRGIMGQKRLVKIDWLVPSRADAHDPGTGILADQSGGALGALGSHSSISWLFGPVRRLCAQLSTAIPLRPDPTQGLWMDDTCMLMLELADGPCQVCISACTFQGALDRGLR